MTWIEELNSRKRGKGSLPRCLLMMHGERAAVAARLNEMVAMSHVKVSPDDAMWAPRGIPVQRGNGTWDLGLTREARLGEADGYLTHQQRLFVTQWWLKVIKRSNTPNWDIASTCTIDGRPGLLLVEAKAHEVELSSGGRGKLLGPKASANSRANHDQIGCAIASARVGLQNATSSSWAISRDTHYQMSNRFAWAWKLASMGLPVALIYLGFLNANEMSKPFGSHEAWEKAVYRHSDGTVPAAAWNLPIVIARTPIFARIRSITMDLPVPPPPPPCEEQPRPINKRSR